MDILNPASVIAPQDGYSIRDAEIPPDDYYPQGYKPELMPFWPTDKPIFIAEDKVPPGLKLQR